MGRWARSSLSAKNPRRYSTARRGGTPRGVGLVARGAACIGVCVGARAQVTAVITEYPADGCLHGTVPFAKSLNDNGQRRWALAGCRFMRGVVSSSPIHYTCSQVKP